MVLTDKDIKDIKRKKKAGQTFDSLAIEYGVSMSTIARVIYPHYRKKWSDWQREHYRQNHKRVSSRSIVAKPNEVHEKVRELIESMFDRTVPMPDLKITIKPVREKKDELGERGAVR